MMTALAFVFGVMPMLFSNGAGAASRIALGTAVVFGMAVNGLMGTLFASADRPATPESDGNNPK